MDMCKTILKSFKVLSLVLGWTEIWSTFLYLKIYTDTNQEAGGANQDGSQSDGSRWGLKTFITDDHMLKQEPEEGCGPNTCLVI